MFPKRVVKRGRVAVAPFRRRIQRPFSPALRAFQALARGYAWSRTPCAAANAAFQKLVAMKAAKRRAPVRARFA